MPKNISESYKNSIEKTADKKQRKQRDNESIMEKPLEIISMQATENDPNGSYTGVPQNPYEKPVQDADDL